MTAPARSFDGYLSGHYARLGDHARYRERRRAQLLRTYGHLLPPDPGAEMLEIGPGHGQWLEALRRDRGFARAIAVDLSPEVVATCNALLPQSTQLVADTTAFLAGTPRRFQRVFAFHVLEHVPRPELPALAQAIRRALCPGGLFVLEVPNMANWVTGSFLRYADLTHESGFTETSVHQLLEAAGFRDIVCFEDRPGATGLRGVALSAFRGTLRALHRVAYKAYQLPVPAVLTPVLCAAAHAPGSPDAGE